MYHNIIHVDGIDKTGKSTLRAYMTRQTNGRYSVYDRSHISQIVYNRLFNRNMNETFYWDKMARDYLSGEKFVYLYCDNSVIVSRIALTNEKDITVYDIQKHKEMFECVVKEAIEIYNINVIQINVSNKTVDEIYLEIQKHVLRDTINNCRECELCNLKVNEKDFAAGSGKLVPNIISNKPKYLIVGMNPSTKRTANTQHPFDVTESNLKNAVFVNILKKYDIYNQSVITNIVKCSTANNIITIIDFDACRFHLEAEIELFKPQYIICLGNVVYDFLSVFNDFNNRLIKIHHPAYQYAYNKMTVEEYDQHIYDCIKHTL